MSHAIAPGSELKDRYQLKRMLGHGGMASVWLGHDHTLDRPVAIKVLSDAIAFDPGFLARFRREARVAAQLSHPNLVGVYDYSDGPERPYLVMEYVPGGSLAARISEESPVDCRKIAIELLGAVAHIHAAGIVHRDIKPHNILLTPDDTVKLIDFGIALPPDATALTATGQILGTERYAAPEVRQGMPATERSDLYSCGVVLRSCPGESSALEPLIAWLTCSDPANRPASSRQALAQLERRVRIPGPPTQEYSPTFARQMPVASDSRTAAPSDSSRRPAIRSTPLAPQEGSRRTRLGAALALLAILVAIGVAIALSAAGGDNHGATAGGGGQGTAGVSHRSNTGTAPVQSAPASEPTEAEQVESTAGSETSVSVPEPAGEDPALGASLNQQGFELIQAEKYEDAVPVLEDAVRAFPPETEELEYAYALFNLGHALRLSGRAEEAVPVLERRLEIPDQTDVVRSELDAARSEAG
ncbi:MAG TPA: serine/threonine-protein kinase [Solirubrobacterales bacterium]|nr:serine/threonine-protein kinase [Solirubrobacterales bacterium]